MNICISLKAENIIKYEFCYKYSVLHEQTYSYSNVCNKNSKCDILIQCENLVQIASFKATTAVVQSTANQFQFMCLFITGSCDNKF